MMVSLPFVEPAHTRQSRPDSGLGMQAEVREIFLSCPLFARKRLGKKARGFMDSSAAGAGVPRSVMTSLQGHLAYKKTNPPRTLP